MTSFHRDAVERVDADDALLACTTLSRIDHVDAHQLHTDRAGTHSPEQWSREIIEHTSSAMRLRLRTGWTALGIVLHHGEPDTIAGWQIAHNSPDHVRLQGNSRLGLAGELVTRVTEDDVTFATFVRLSNPAARLMWAKVLPAHLTIVRSLVQAAAERTA